MSLLDLAERVEAAKGADRYLDACISAAVRLDKVPGWAKLWSGEWLAGEDGLVTLRQSDGTDGPNFRASKWTASLDAAMTLVPEGMLVMVTNCGAADPKQPDMTKATAIVGSFSATMDDPVEAATPALALVAASLRARHALAKEVG